MVIRTLAFALATFAALPLAGQALLSATPGVQTYANPALGLRLSYPATLNREDVAQVGKFPGAIFSLHPETAAADPCAPVLLTLGSSLDRDQEILEKGKAAVLQPKGTLALSEIKRSCFDAGALDDTILSEAIAATGRIEGMRPLAKMSNTFVQGSTVWFAATAGYNKDAKGKRNAAAGSTIVGTAGASVNGHLLVWTVTANEPALFNHLLTLSVCFDSTCDQGIGALTPFRLNAPAANQVASR